MSPTGSTATAAAAGIAPTVEPQSPWRVATVQAHESSRLEVTFRDGARGDVLLAALLADPTTDGTVFEALRDPAEFARVQVLRGVVTWPSGADLAPDAMYDEIAKAGVWHVPAGCALSGG